LRAQRMTFCTSSSSCEISNLVGSTLQITGRIRRRWWSQQLSENSSGWRTPLAGSSQGFFFVPRLSMPAESSSRRSEPREPLEQLFYWRLEFSTSSFSSTEVKRSFDVPCSNRRCSSSVNDYVISFFFGFNKQHSFHFSSCWLCILVHM